MSTQSAILSGWLYVPLGYIGDSTAQAALKQRLTYMPKYAEEDEEPVRLYTEEKSGYLGVPRAFGLHYFQNIPVIDRTTLGSPMLERDLYRRPDPNHPSVRDPAAQAAFMANLHQTALEYKTFIGCAPTGSGKSVSFIDASLNLGRKTLILVHLERLMMQWIDDTLVKIIGVPRDRIGIVQGPTCQFEEKDFVVGMLHSTNLRTYPEAFYSAFGLIGFDEVHKVGSRFFAPTVPLFNSRYKIGLSATPTRKDGGDRVFVWHLGPTRVKSTADAMPMDVHVLRYDNPTYNHPSKYAGRPSHGALAKALSLDPRRNARILRMITNFYNKGRQAIIVGESVAHLQMLMEQAHKAGVPKEAMGQFTSEIHHREVVQSPGGGKRVVVKKRKQHANALSYVKENAQLIFATYGMMTEGIDIPRLDAGIDVTPRGSATQLVGRIRRPLPGKKKPVWVTILDTDCPMARRYYTNRYRDYTASKAEVYINGKAAQNANS